MANVGTSRDGATSRNVDASIDIKRLVKSMTEKSNNLSPLSPECCIYEVSKKIQKINEEAYTPVRVSIGLFHHGKKGLQPMEEHKWRYFNDFMQQSQKNLDELIKFMAKNEERIRHCYAKTISLKSEEFLEIILVDATFIIEFLLRYWFKDLITPNDRIFRKPWLINDISHDLLLLENQFPFFVLQDLFEMANINLHSDENDIMPSSMIDLTLQWFLASEKIEEPLDLEDINPSEVKHFLDFLRNCLIPKKSLQPPVPVLEEISPSKVEHFINLLRSYLMPRKILQQTKRGFEFIQSATELHEAGVKFMAIFWKSHVQK